MYAKTESLMEGAARVLSLSPGVDGEHNLRVWCDLGDVKLGDIVDPGAGRVILSRMRQGHAIPGGSPVLAGKAREAQDLILDRQKKALCGRWPG